MKRTPAFHWIVRNVEVSVSPPAAQGGCEKSTVENAAAYEAGMKIPRYHVGALAKDDDDEPAKDEDESANFTTECSIVYPGEEKCGTNVIYSRLF